MRQQIVLHTHWDREWYFTTSDSLVLMDKVFKNIIIELEKSLEVKFCLDGQSSILEEFLQINPHWAKRVETLIQNDQLIVGPWYTQTDVQLVNAESILHNLYYGITTLKQKYNKYMSVGYLPDTFGFSANMPKIYNFANIKYAVMWRGADFETQKINPYFNWKSNDGSEVSTTILHNGYGMAKKLNASDEFINLKLKPLINEYEKMGIKNLLLPVGNDQFEIVFNISKIIQEINNNAEIDLELSDYESFFETLDKSQLKEYIGEFRKTRYTRIHKSIGSVRYDIKYANSKIENQLLNQTEPLMYMAKQFGIDVSPHLLYEAWKLIMAVHAHDGICGCVSEDVHLDIMNRLKNAQEIASSIENRIKFEIANSLNLNDQQVMIYNTTLQKGKFYKVVKVLSHSSNVTIKEMTDATILSVNMTHGHENALIEKPEGNIYQKEANYYEVEIGGYVELPAFGYKVFEIVENNEKKNNQNSNCIQNEHYTITFENNELTLKTKEKTLTNFIKFETVANDGDTYDFSPMLKSKVHEFTFNNSHAIVNNKVMEINFVEKLAFDELNNDNNIVATNFKLKISLIDDRIDFNLSFINQVKSYRLRVIIDPDDTIDETYAQVPFGFQKRKVLNDQAEKSNWRETEVEKPIDIETTSGTITSIGKGNKMAIALLEAKEYQVIDNKYFLTVIATTSQLGKENLVNRPGRASGDTTKLGHIYMPTPSAELLNQTINYNFSINFLPNNDYELNRHYQKACMQTTFYQKQEINKFYNRIDSKLDYVPLKNKINEQHKSFLEFNEKLIVQAITPSLTDDTFIIRGYNPHNETITIKNLNFEYEQINLLEEKINSEQVKPYALFALKIKK